MVETGLDKDVIKELYQVFLDELLAEKEKLINYLSEKDFIKLGKTVHNIKGISGSFKTGQVFEQASLIDRDTKNGKFEGIGNSLADLTNLIDRAVMDIKRYFKM